ncbi:hypothetical protein M0D21_22060 [Aquimarina sp. D1M17]|uniref:hypothetical protein n=1 Tax=Aquimarina acroporae TaxID=2937283 RepID=UPI0020C04F59|nr:hypothetical protein [Aquimarina acroporae]MCK8524279.1 hypothetical protein [Aquimarina acroporae]
MEEEEDKRPQRSWNLMIGISMVIIGSLQLYNRLQEEGEWNSRSFILLIFIIFGAYVLFRHFRSSN